MMLYFSPLCLNVKGRFNCGRSSRRTEAAAATHTICLWLFFISLQVCVCPLRRIPFIRLNGLVILDEKGRRSVGPRRRQPCLPTEHCKVDIARL